MGRIIAIDYGTKRSGIAVTDTLRIIANPLDTIQTNKLKEFLEKYIAQNNVDIIVVGMPRNTRGEPSDSFEHIKPFIKWLEQTFQSKKIVMHDERFTSVIAQRAIREGGVKKMARRDKALVDRVSAAIILQGYLESMEYKMEKL